MFNTVVYDIYRENFSHLCFICRIDWPGFDVFGNETRVDFQNMCGVPWVWTNQISQLCWFSYFWWKSRFTKTRSALPPHRRTGFAGVVEGLMANNLSASSRRSAAGTSWLKRERATISAVRYHRWCLKARRALLATVEFTASYCRKLQISFRSRQWAWTAELQDIHHELYM